MGRQLFHSTEVVLGDVSLGRVLGVSIWCITHGWHIGSTPVWAQYMYFWLFNIKSICIIFWKFICIMKKTLVFKKYFRPPMMFSLKETEIHIFVIVSFKKKLFHILVLYSANMILLNNVLDLSITSTVGFYSISILHWAYVLLTLLLLSFSG